MTERNSKMTIVLGRNGTGKSTLLRQILEHSGRKCLVVTPDDIEWRDFKENPLAEPKDFVFNGIQRHIFDPTPKKGTLAKLEYFKKGIIVLDDCRAYLNDRTDQHIREMIIRRRQREIDIFAVGHGFKEVPPVFFTFLSEVILFSTTDNVILRKNCLKDFDRMLSAQTRVNRIANKNPHYFEVVKWIE